MKKKISTTQAFLILFAATVVLILHFTCPGNVLQLGDVTVFWSEGKIVQYASIENKTFDFKRAPNILTHDIACSNKTFALGPICINWKRTEHTYQ